MFIKSMSLLESLQVSAFGMTVVFIALIGLCIIIVLLSKILGALKTGNSSAQPQETSINHQASAVTPAAAPAQLQLINVDEKTAAIIMAIVSDELKEQPSLLNFKYIKQL